MNETNDRAALERRLVSLEEKNGRLTSALTTARPELALQTNELGTSRRQSAG